ncbi:MAG: hypothetical protein PWQ66_206 [Petrotoga sp.]|jgi:hypothetical protein|nr:hypothetical protein [Petrotoga sp.]
MQMYKKKVVNDNLERSYWDRIFQIHGKSC